MDQIFNLGLTIQGPKFEIPYMDKFLFIYVIIIYMDKFLFIYVIIIYMCYLHSQNIIFVFFMSLAIKQGAICRYGDILI
jgi:hypothetical protein